MRRLVPTLLLAAACLAIGARAEAQELTRAVRERCIQSIVRVQIETPNGMLTGSGTIIDPRGYVLTNFHVVGHLDHRQGLPGTQHGQRFRVAVVANERDAVEDGYVAEVVRGHIGLDLALLRIVERIDGTPVTTPLPAMAIADRAPELGTQVWALGFPAGVRTVNITAGQVAGFEQNDAGETAWLRTDTEFNPGNSGGALIDRECRLVGVPTAVSENVEPIELARPALRIPAAWRAALASGADLARAPTEGIGTLTSLTELVDAHFGDNSGRTGEHRYYALPRVRPAVVSVSPRLTVRAIGGGGRLLRGGEGQVLITASDPQSTLVYVFVPRSQTGVSPVVRLRYSPMSEASVEAPRATAIRGRVTRSDGGSCTTYAVLAERGVDLRALREQLSSGEIGEDELRRRTTRIVRADDDGRFAIEASTGSFELGFLGPRGVEQRSVDVSESGVDLGDIPLETPCP